jgi:hypothetical protein
MITGGRLQSFRHWLETWFSQAKQTDGEEQLQRPPAAVTALINQALQTLPHPETQITTIQTLAQEAIVTWQTQQEAENSLVILSSPVQPIETILREALGGWSPASNQPVTLKWPFKKDYRCRDALAIPALLHNRLDPVKAEAEEIQHDQDSEALEGINDRLDDRQTVVVIPALEFNFLRCIQGWEGVEYLQNLITQDRSRFWILGCNTWGWTFLDRVCRVGAYLEQVKTLPPMTDEDLRTWLHPVAQDIVLPEQVEDADAPLTYGSDSYWNALAGLASGINTTAAGLWTRSHRIPKAMAEQMEELDLGDVQSLEDLLEQFPLQLELVKPTLPGLMSLEPLDRYLLHSLLIHRRMSRDHLAQSLGETDRLVRTRLQVLRREGVILQARDEVWVNPMQYPKLRSELSNNNYLIGEV